MTLSSLYIDRIREHFPDLPIVHLEVAIGSRTDVVIVNSERVFRFARTGEASRRAMAREIRVLQLARTYVDMPVPQIDVCQPDLLSYPMLSGWGMTRADILRLDARLQDAVAKQLAIFLQQLHAVPLGLPGSELVERADVEQTQDQILALYEAVEREVMSGLPAPVRRIVRDRFTPVLDGRIDLSAGQVLIHGDLGQDHVLYSPAARRITGIVDFGVAGLGHPAFDYATVISWYGERFLRRMAQFTPEIEGFLDWARFFAGTLEVGWALRSIQESNPFWMGMVFGSARDVAPIGTRWT